LIDTHRRVNFLQANNLDFSSFLDFGCGCGGILEIVSDSSSIVDGLEIQKNKVSGLRLEGYRVFEQIKELKDARYSLVTMFHVLEHLSDPINTLISIKSKLKEGGTLLIEVPNSNDVLIEHYQCESFIKHTLWSEHLVLYTKESLRKLLKIAGYEVKFITGVQRYPISNHVKWLTGQVLDGTQKSILDSDILFDAYTRKLNSISITDTLIAGCTIE
jgi:2-polyprenyl-3-methyl-5-hydroxy-6-metoxy-1,4-benzoquinol methylase